MNPPRIGTPVGVKWPKHLQLQIELLTRALLGRQESDVIRELLEICYIAGFTEAQSRYESLMDEEKP